MKLEATSRFPGTLALLSLALTGSLLHAAPAKEESNPTLFNYQSKTFRLQELKPATQQAIYDAEKLRYDNITRIIENAILEEYIQGKAKSSNKSPEQIEEEVFKTNLSDKDARKWYDENKARLGGRDFDSIKTEILHYLKKEEQEKIRDSVVDRIKKEGKFSLLVKEPEAPSFEIATQGYPSRGADKAKVTIVEFADYQCPHCKAASTILKKVVEQYKDKVKLIFLDFPLREHGISTTVALGAACADAQNKFWDFHYMAFEQQASLTDNSPGEFAKKLNLDLGKFDKCLKSDEVKKKVDQARTEGERIGVQATPAIYLNGRRQMGYSEEALVNEIKKNL